MNKMIPKLHALTVSSQSSIESSPNDGISNEGSQSYALSSQISLSSLRSGDRQEDSVELSKDSLDPNISK